MGFCLNQNDSEAVNMRITIMELCGRRLICAYIAAALCIVAILTCGCGRTEIAEPLTYNSSNLPSSGDRLRDTNACAWGGELYYCEDGAVYSLDDSEPVYEPDDFAVDNIFYSNNRLYSWRADTQSVSVYNLVTDETESFALGIDGEPRLLFVAGGRVYIGFDELVISYPADFGQGDNDGDESDENIVNDDTDSGASGNTDTRDDTTDETRDDTADIRTDTTSETGGDTAETGDAADTAAVAAGRIDYALSGAISWFDSKLYAYSSDRISVVDAEGGDVERLELTLPDGVEYDASDLWVCDDGAIYFSAGGRVIYYDGAVCRDVTPGHSFDELLFEYAGRLYYKIEGRIFSLEGTSIKTRLEVSTCDGTVFLAGDRIMCKNDDRYEFVKQLDTE